MHTTADREFIRVLVADDDEHVLECYREAFAEEKPTHHMQALDTLAAELFDPQTETRVKPRFHIVVCNQGADAIRKVRTAQGSGESFDVIILDIRMPPGIDGVEAGSRIRKLDPEVKIVFVTGYFDLAIEELRRRIPPPVHLHHFNKPLSFSRLAKDVATMVLGQ